MAIRHDELLDQHDRRYDFSERDPKLCQMARTIRSMPVEQRLLQIEAEADFFANAKPVPQ